MKSSNCLIMKWFMLLSGLRILMLMLAVMLTITHVHAAIINNTAFNGTYTSSASTNLAFTPVAGKIYGISASMDISKFTSTTDDQTGNYSGFFIGNPNYGNGQTWYVYGGSPKRFVNTFGVGGANQDLGSGMTGPLYTGFSLDTTGPTWTVNYYYGGTGFDANSVYQGATAYKTVTGIAPGSINAINFLYEPCNALGTEAINVISDFKVVENVRSSWISSGKAYVDGVAFFPLGFYTAGATAAEMTAIKNAGFNCVIDYLYGSDFGTSDASTFLEDAASSGIKVVYSLSGCIDWDDAKTTSYINAVKGKSALLGWYIADEVPPDRIAELNARYTFIKNLDASSHLIFQVTNLPGYATQYTSSCDILGNDNYLYPNVNYDGVYIAQKPIDDAQAAVNRPSFGVTQVHDNGIYGYGSGEPSAADKKCFAYLSLAAGARGLFLYSHFDMKSNVDHTPASPDTFNRRMNEVKAIATEVNQMQAALAGGDNVSIPGAPPAGVRIRMVKLDSDNFLIMANAYDFNQPVSLQIPAGFVSAVPLDGSSPWLVQNNVLTGTIGAHTGIAFRLAAAAPTYQASGSVVSGTSAITPVWPAHQPGDIALLVIETANQTVSLATNAGFTEVTGSPQGTGTAAGTAATRLAVFWKRATTSSESSPTVADSGNHQIAQIITFRGVTASGNPWDVTAGNVASSAGTSVSIPGGTTTVANGLVVTIVANRTDTTIAQTSGWSNSNLTGLTERVDRNTSSGNGGGFGVATGVKSTAGAYGATSATLATSSVQARLSIALKP